MDTTAADFDKDVLEASDTVPVLVDFWAPWCGPCRVLGPVLERLADKAAGAWRLVKLDTEQHPDIAMRYRVSGIPDVRLFHRRAIVASFTGAVPESEVSRWLAAALPSPAADVVEAGVAAWAAGDAPKAQALARQALDKDAHNPRAQALLGRALLGADPNAALAAVADVHEGDEVYPDADAIRTLHRLMHLRPDDALRARPAWSTYEAALAALRAADYDAAAEGFIDVTRRDRKLDDDGARRACVALFHWLGEDHPTTRTHRRAFSTALF